MSCRCENTRLGKELDRIRRLAKGLAVECGMTVALYSMDDGTYRFSTIDKEITKPIIEFITPY